MGSRRQRRRSASPAQGMGSPWTESEKKGNEMVASSGSANSSFSERVAAVLGKVSFRRASSGLDAERVYHMRSVANARLAGRKAVGGGQFRDEVCEVSPNCYDIMMFLDSEFVCTFRVFAARGEDAALPSLVAFGDVLQPLLHQGRVIVDLTEIAMKLEYVCALPEASYFVVRGAWLAAEHFDADIITTTAYAEDQPVWARMFGFRALSSSRSASQAGRNAVCLALDCRANRDRLESRYPFFRSTEAERHSIFGPPRGLAANSVDAAWLKLKPEMTARAR